MDAATLTAVGSIVVGLAAAAGAVIGQRGANTASQSGAVFGGLSTLVDNLQEERDKTTRERDELRAALTEKERLLAAAYAELARERAAAAGWQAHIAELTTEIAALRARLAELEGPQP